MGKRNDLLYRIIALVAQAVLSFTSRSQAPPEKQENSVFRRGTEEEVGRAAWSPGGAADWAWRTNHSWNEDP